MVLSVFVEPHLPRVRSLRILDSLRAIIAFREACDPHVWINTCVLVYGVVKGAWMIVLASLCFLRSIVIKRKLLGLFKTFAPKHNLIFRRLRVPKDIEREG